MKKIIAIGIAIIAFSSTVQAQSDASLTWSVDGLFNVDELRLDVNFGNRYLPSNGVILQSGGLSVPIAGTCFETAQGGVFCTFSVQEGSTLVLELQSSLDGTLRTVGVSGATIESGSVTLLEVF